MLIEFDSAKREQTLIDRGLDFADAPKIFSGKHFTLADDRADYGEQRFISVGKLVDRIVVLIWTPRGEVRRIISMRYANEREKIRYAQHL
ncbi:MAG: BrnT family toxin, partial [Sulfuricella sp.]|nr:BrnT family toxin [Sulfuricella sp.]